jgi:hypothetical protein
MIDLGSYTFVKVIANEGAPAEQASLHGYTFNWPAGEGVPEGMDTLRINGLDLYGYARNINGEWQWVLQPQPDPNVVAINKIPRPEGWNDPAARQVYLNTGQFLLAAGVTASVLRPGLQALFDAARAELLSEGWQPL